MWRSLQIRIPTRRKGHPKSNAPLDHSLRLNDYALAASSRSTIRAQARVNGAGSRTRNTGASTQEQTLSPDQPHSKRTSGFHVKSPLRIVRTRRRYEGAVQAAHMSRKRLGSGRDYRSGRVDGSHGEHLDRSQ